MRLRAPRVANLALVVCAFLALALTNVSASAAAPTIVSTSSTDHLWFVIEQQHTTSDGMPRIYRLYHYASAMAGATVSSEATIPTLSQYPEAMAAWESQLWIVNPAKPSQESARRDVFTVSVHFDATFDVYEHDPHDRLLAIEPLPAEGRLAGFVALASGPVALLAPTARGISSVVAADGTRPSEHDLSHPRLLRLKNGTWEDIPLPADFPANPNSRIGASRTDDGVLNLLATPEARGASATTTLYRLVDNEWTRSTLPFTLSSVRSLTSVLGECAVVLDDRQDPKASVAIIGQDRFQVVATFDPPDSPWTMLGLASDLRLITRGPVNQAYMQRFDPLTGTVAAREEFEAIRPSLAILVHLGVVIFVVVAASVLAFLLAKWRVEAPLNLPEGWSVLRPVGRAMALLIDLVPGGFITMLLLRCDVTELINSPIAVPRFELALPYLLMTGLTMLHSGVWEIMTGTSLGKSLLGAKVTDVNGNRLRPGATLIRLAFKAMVLFVPILVFPTIISRRGQGLGERAVGAVVIYKDEHERSA